MIDLHLHTTASDGRLEPAELVRAAVSAGLHTISVTDHDTIGGLAAARAECERLGVRLVTGIEITAVEDGRDVHILGYFFNADDPALRTFLADQRVDRVRRVRQIAERLTALGFRLDVEPIVAAAASDPGRSIGRPQVADALVGAGHAADRRDAFDRLLAAGRPAFVPRRGPDVEAVVRILHEAGGVASMAHPALTGMDDRIPAFARSGLDALEARHSDHSAEDEARYRRFASGLGLLTTAGSDFHGDPSQHAPGFGIVSLPPDEFAGLEARAGLAAASRQPR